jgi:hypothetical protein
MDLHTEPDGRLIVTSTSRVLDWLLLLGTALCTVPTIRGALHGSFTLHESTPLIGSAFFFIGFLVAYERTWFEFNLALSCVRWSRTRWWSNQEGFLLFTRVKSVVLQTSLGETATCPSYRIALISDQGELPLTTAYAGGMHREYEAIVARIRTLLSLSPSSSDILMDSVRVMLEQGRKIDAIRLVSHHKGLSLTEAKRFVEQLQRSPSPASAPLR